MRWAVRTPFLFGVPDSALNPFETPTPRLIVLSRNMTQPPGYFPGHTVYYGDLGTFGILYPCDVYLASSDLLELH
jgi:hypothetical protein